MSDPSAQPLTRPAHLGDILTVTTGLMCAPGGEDGLLRMVGFMVNRNLYPFQLLRAVPFIEPSLHEQFPALAALQPPHLDGLPRPERGAATKAWLNEMVIEHGMMHRVQQLSDGVWEDRDPVAEWNELTGGKPFLAKVDMGAGTGEIMVALEPGSLKNMPFDPGERTIFSMGK